MAEPNLTPKKRRGGGAWVPAFIATLRNTGNVRAACQVAGIARVTAYERRDRYPDFAREWEEALKEALDILKAVAWKRAQETSDTLLIFLLKSYEPETFRETVRHEVVRAEAERLASQYGLDPSDVIAEAERLMAGGH